MYQLRHPDVAVIGDGATLNTAICCFVFVAHYDRLWHCGFVPKVTADPVLLSATRIAVRKHDNNQAAAAKELGVSRVFMTRFLRGGRALPASREKLRRGLLERGYLASERADNRVSLDKQVIPDHEIVKQALRYLLNAVEAYEEEEGSRGL